MKHLNLVKNFTEVSFHGFSWRKVNAGGLAPVRSLAFGIDGFMQERRDSTANALGLRISCTNPLLC